jgi:pilus assembly protein Flp/PilA
MHAQETDLRGAAGRLCSACSTAKGAAVISMLVRDRGGVTAIEYGLIVGAIAVAIIAAVYALGGDIANLFGTAGSTLSSTNGSTA